MSRLTNTLPLGAFIKRQQTFKLYKQLRRTARKIEDSSVKQGIFEQIRTDFRQNQLLKDAVSIKSAMVQGQRNLALLQDLVGETAVRKSVAVDVKPGVAGGSTAAKSDNSWLNNSTGDDQRGRVGTGWPWKT
jgi:hypothetical protein